MEPKDLERFTSKYTEDPESGCWVWHGSRTPLGYGRFWFGRGQQAHRVSYEYHVGPIPEGLHIDHLCRNTSCVNPDHLEPVTPRENILRGIGVSAKNARKIHCPVGHPYTPENTYIAPNGSRKCKRCHKEYLRKHWNGSEANRRWQRERYHSDPSIRERRVQAAREQYASDPEFREKKLARQREAYRRKKESA